MKKTYVKPVLGRLGGKPQRTSADSTPEKIPHTNLAVAGETVAMVQTTELDPIVSVTAGVVSAYIANNSLPAADLPGFIGQVYSSLKHLADGSPAPRVSELKAAVPVKKSITPDFIFCLEDGKPFKSLKRHLSVHYGLTPDQYRTKWSLPPEYPMTAPNYSSKRSTLAKSMGLGQKPR